MEVEASLALIKDGRDQVLVKGLLVGHGKQVAVADVGALKRDLTLAIRCVHRAVSRLRQQGSWWCSVQRTACGLPRT